MQHFVVVLFDVIFFVATVGVTAVVVAAPCFDNISRTRHTYSWYVQVMVINECFIIELFNCCLLLLLLSLLVMLLSLPLLWEQFHEFDVLIGGTNRLLYLWLFNIWTFCCFYCLCFYCWCCCCCYCHYFDNSFTKFAALIRSKEKVTALVIFVIYSYFLLYHH